jgi:hypothetical protein
MVQGQLLHPQLNLIFVAARRRVLGQNLLTVMSLSEKINFHIIIIIIIITTTTTTTTTTRF